MNDDLLGWATQPLIQLDDLAPGLIRRVVTSAPMVRQAIFLALAHRNPHPDQQQLAELLRRQWAKNIIHKAFGTAPQGLLATLERIGLRPLSEYAYKRIWEVFTDDDQRKADVLRRTAPKLTERMLRVLDALDGPLAHPEVLKRVATPIDANDLKQSVAFIQAVCSKATDKALVDAFGRMEQHPNALPTTLQRFLRRADQFPEPPVKGDELLRPINSGRDLVDAARRYRNCLAAKIGEVLGGMVAFYEYNGQFICEVKPLSHDRGWLLNDVYGEMNGLVPMAVKVAAEAKCAEFGIAHMTVPESVWSPPVRRMLRKPLFMG